MNIEYDPAKREKTLNERGLDFDDVVHIFTGVTVTMQDTRKDYGEVRYTTVGILKGRVVLTVWTPRENTHRIISMGKANEREITKFAPYLE